MKGQDARLLNVAGLNGIVSAARRPMTPAWSQILAALWSVVIAVLLTFGLAGYGLSASVGSSMVASMIWKCEVQGRAAVLKPSSNTCDRPSTSAHVTMTTSI